MGRNRRRYAGGSIVAVAGLVVAGILTARGESGPVEATAVAGRDTTTPAATGRNTSTPAAPHTERWTQRATAHVELAGARRTGAGVRLDLPHQGTRAEDTRRSPDTGIEGGVAFRPHRMARFTNRISARVDAGLPSGSDAVPEIRGWAPGGFWTEWIRARSDRVVSLPVPVRTVQVRVALTAGLHGARPSVRSVTLSAGRPRTPPRVTNTPAFHARVFAIREGRIGDRTANGHLITADDHFVALPSRSVLSARGRGDYTVRVCHHRRCAYAPVWDVGPWNIRDAHWRRDRPRQNALRRGLPQAQAAVQKHADGGRDEFGRRVRNPAGIELGDGTARQTLHIGAGGWVRVTYLWTGGYPHHETIHAMADWHTTRLYHRPTRDSRVVGAAVNGVQVGMDCQVHGQRTKGAFGVSDLWDHIGPGTYVPHAYVARSNAQVARTCPASTEADGSTGTADPHQPG